MVVLRPRTQGAPVIAITGATEDPASGRAARPGGSDHVPPSPLSSPGATATAAASASAPAGEAAASSARARRCKRRAESRRQVSDRQRARAGAEVARWADPVDRALVVQLLGHVQVRPLEHAL